jgi:hypothetical protein
VLAEHPARRAPTVEAAGEGGVPVSRGRQAGDPGHLACCLPWLQSSLEEARNLIGKDFWPYGIGPNRKTLETVLAYLHEQGLTRTALRIADLFEVVDEHEAVHA